MSANAEPMVRFEAFTKSFGSVDAVRPFNLEISKGESFALLGPNGGGKTTVLRGLVGLHSPTSGRILVRGSDIERGARQSTEVARLRSATGHHARRPHRSRNSGALRGTEEGGPRSGRRGFGPPRPFRRRQPAGGRVLRRHAATARARRSPSRGSPTPGVGRANPQSGPARNRQSSSRHWPVSRSGEARSSFPPTVFTLPSGWLTGLVSWSMASW